MALGAADRVEERFTRHSGARRLRRLREVALEVGDAVDECGAEVVGRIFDVVDGVAIVKKRRVTIWRCFKGNHGICEAHLIARGVARKTTDRRNLCLPTKAANTQRA